ncbi:MAG TPA: outer membrane lipoprotein carrier protein LolA [Planosporangium sp.]|jgi:outer membrane lipoprotein-sorting protein|nr:outer membrane lipoprotein carrier protein LolA [Planosporangium sp.]
MSITTSRPALRWGVPVAVLVTVVGGGAAVRTLTASADPSLPARTAAQLLVDLQTARLDGGSGTVVQQADLGLPALPGLGGQGSSSLQSLASGSHTMRVWYAGPERARVALLGTLGESDVIRDGRDVWVWDSEQNTATHSVLPAEDPGAPHPATAASALPRTPQEAANAALAAIDPTTKVTANGSARVAGRSAYELVLTPRDTGSLVGRVTLAIDAERHVPLRVAVYPAGSDSTAFKVEFTQVSFARPDPALFRFAPPPGTRVTQESADKQAPDAAGAPQQPTVVGKGWTSVLVAKLPAQGVGALPGDPQAGNGQTGNAQAGRDGKSFSLDNLPKVSGAWGSGHLLTSRLFSVLLTDDGRLLAGAVRPEQLYAAAAAR